VPPLAVHESVIPAIPQVSTVTTTITSGALRVTIAGVNYDQIFNTDANTTVADWLTTHSGAIIATFRTVSVATNVITVTGNVDGSAFTLASSILAGTGTATPTLVTTGVASSPVTYVVYGLMTIPELAGQNGYPVLRVSEPTKKHTYLDEAFLLDSDRRAGANGSKADVDIKTDAANALLLLTNPTLIYG